MIPESGTLVTVVLQNTATRASMWSKFMKKVSNNKTLHYLVNTKIKLPMLVINK